MHCPQNTIINKPVGNRKIKIQQTHCMKGHEFTEENTILRANGKRLCRTCRKASKDTEREAAAQLTGDAKLAHWLKREYHLSLEQYTAILEKQDHKCPICNDDFVKDKFVIDHDHSCCPGIRSCGKCVRGVVCRGCNVKLGAIDFYFSNKRKIDGYYSAYTSINLRPKR